MAVGCVPYLRPQFRAVSPASEHFGSAAASAAGSDESKQSDAHNALMQLQQDMALLAFPDPEHCGVPAYEVRGFIGVPGGHALISHFRMAGWCNGD